MTDKVRMILDEGIKQGTLLKNKYPKLRVLSDLACATLWGAFCEIRGLPIATMPSEEYFKDFGRGLFSEGGGDLN